MDPIAEAHRQEVLEGILDAAFNADQASFKAFYPEWERIDQGENSIRFEGMPRPYIANGFCFHCNESWLIHGVAFHDDDPIIESDCLEVHVHHGGCSRSELCRCFTDSTFETAQCQMCFEPMPGCSCTFEVPGPCLEPMVTLQWMR